MKAFWKSKTIWGIVIAVTPTVLRMLGVPVPIGMGEVLNEVLVASGSGLAVYGRVKAHDGISLK